MTKVCHRLHGFSPAPKNKEPAPDINTVYITIAELVTQLHGEGKEIYAWTANSHANMLKIIRMGADGLVTDNPPLANFFLNVTDRNYFLNSLAGLLCPKVPN